VQAAPADFVLAKFLQEFGVTASARHYFQYAGGREGDWLLIAFSPRKQSLTYGAPKPTMALPHICGSLRVASFMSLAMAKQSSRVCGSGIILIKPATL
jgi:hypothetical protein